jgi:hypothetical protein
MDDFPKMKDIILVRNSFLTLLVFSNNTCYYNTVGGINEQTHRKAKNGS